MRQFGKQLVKRVCWTQAARKQLNRCYSYTKVKDFVVKAWKDTYPDEDSTHTNFSERVTEKKKKAALDREEKEKFENLTEEEIAEVSFSWS